MFLEQNLVQEVQNIEDAQPVPMEVGMDESPQGAAEAEAPQPVVKLQGAQPSEANSEQAGRDQAATQSMLQTVLLENDVARRTTAPKQKARRPPVSARLLPQLQLLLQPDVEQVRVGELVDHIPPFSLLAAPERCECEGAGQTDPLSWPDQVAGRMGATPPGLPPPPEPQPPQAAKPLRTFAV